MVKNSASPQRPFFLFVLILHAILPLFEQNYPSMLSFFSQDLGTGPFLYTYRYIFISFLFLKTMPTSNPKGGGGGGGGILHMYMNYSFSYGATPKSGPKGGASEMPPPLYPRMYIATCIRTPRVISLPCLLVHTGNKQRQCMRKCRYLVKLLLFCHFCL